MHTYLARHLRALVIGALCCACTVSRDEQTLAAVNLTWQIAPPRLAVQSGGSAEAKIRATDAKGVPVAGAQLQIIASAPGQVLVEPSLTDAQGYASAQIGCRGPGQVMLKATWQDAGGVVAPAQRGRLNCVENTSPDPDPAAESSGIASDIGFVSLQPVAAADPYAPTRLILVVTNSVGQPVANQIVYLTTTRAGDVIEPNTARTDAQGTVVVALTASSLGASTVVVHAGAVTNTATIQFVAGAPAVANSSWTARAYAQVVADGLAPHTFDLQVRDAAGKVVPAANFTVKSDAAGDVATPNAGTTNAQGQAAVRLTTTRAGPRNVSVTLHNGSLTAPVTFVAGAVDAARSTLVCDPQVIAADGVMPSYVTFAAADAYGNPAAGQNVLLSSSMGQDLIESPMGITDARGLWMSRVTGTQAGMRSITAAFGQTVLSQALTLFAGAPSAQTSTVSVAPSPQIAGQLATLTLELRDAFGNPAGGQNAAFDFPASSDGNLPRGGITDAHGALTAQFTKTLAGVQNIVVTLGSGVGAAVATAHASFVAGPPDAAHATLVASPNIAVADGVAAISLTATFRDAYGNPITSGNVAWAGTSGRDVFDQVSSTPSATGVTSNALRSTLAHGITPTATLQGVTLSAPSQFYAGTPNGPLSALTISPDVQLADGVHKIALTVQLVDAYQNPVPAAIATLTASGVGTVFTPPSGLATDGNGYLISYATTAHVQTQQLEIRVGGLSLSRNVTYTVGPPAVPNSTLVASPNSGLTAHNGSAANFILSVKDAQDHVLSGQPVTFHGPDAATEITVHKAITDSAGQARSAVAGAYAGSRTLFAQVGNITLSSHALFGADPAGGSRALLGVRPSYMPLLGRGVYLDHADVDNNGLPDLLIAQQNPPGLAVVLSLGSGRFAAATSYPISGVPNHLATGALNGDAYADVVVASGGNFITPYLGSAQGTMTQRPLHAANGNIVAVCLGDFTQDGKLDVVALSGQGPAGFTLLAGDGNGGFGAGAFTDMGTGVPVRCAAADLNLDGFVDLAISNANSNAIDVYWGQGDGTFASKVSFGSLSAPTEVAVGHLNADAYPDLIVSSPGANSVSVLLGASGNTFVGQVNYGTEFAPSGLNLVDINQDNNLDMVVASSSYGAYGFNVLLGRGDGTFAERTLSRLASRINAATVADFDGDGLPDVGYTLASSNVAAIAHALSPSAYGAVVHGIQYGNSTTLAIADFDNDHFPDVVIAEFGFTHMISGLRNQATVSFRSFGGYFVNDTLDVGDFNGDGKMDVVRLDAYFNKKGVTFLGDSAMGFSEKTLDLFDVNQYPFVEFQTCVGDLNVDGQDDLILMGNGSSSTSINMATGTQDIFTTTSQAYPPNETFCGRCVVADLDLDGRMDLVMPCNSLWVYPGHGDGTFASPSSYGTTVASGAVREATAADFNEDGYPDIAVSSDRGYLLPYLSLGDGTLQPATPVPASSTYPIFRLRHADFNGDGHVDFAAGGIAGDRISVFYGNGAGTFDVSDHYAVGDLHHIDVGDLNNDGQADIVVSNDFGYVAWVSSGKIAQVGANPNAALSAVWATPGATVANNVSQAYVTVGLKDDYGSFIADGPVSVAVAGAHGNTVTLVPPFLSTTSSTGSYRAAVRSTQAGTFVLTSTYGTVSSNSNVTFVAGPPSPNLSSLVLSPNTMVASVSSNVSVSAIVNDALGNPVPAATVMFSASGTNNVFATATTNSSSSGVATTSFRSSKAEVKQITAAVGGFSLKANVIVVAGSPNFTSSTFSGGSQCLADGAQSLPIAVQLVDDFANPVPNIAVSIANDGNAVLMSPASGLTTTSGNFVSALSSTVVQAMQYGVSCQGSNYTFQGNFILGPPSATTSTVVASPNSGLMADGTSPSTLSIVIKDAYGHPIPSANVGLGLSGPAGMLSSRRVLTSASGMQSATVVSRLAGVLPVFASTGNIMLKTSVLFDANANSCDANLVLGSAPIGFLRPGSGGLGSGVRGIDVNNDGIMDLVSWVGNGNLQVLKGLGGQRYALTSSFAAGQNLNNVEIVDINKDGYLDILVSVFGTGPCVNLYLGSASAVYTPEGSVCAPAGQDQEGLSVRDFDGDGNMDFVTAFSNPAEFRIYRGDGTGNFSLNTKYTMSGGAYSAIKTGDLDHDGNLDIVVNNYGNRTLDVYWGQAGNIYSTSIVTTLAVNSDCLSIDLGNLNADSYLDLIAYNGSLNNARAFMSTGARTYSAVSALGSGAVAVKNLSIVDVNADGNNDLVINGTAGFNILFGRGNGTFLSERFVSLAGKTGPVHAVDMNADGAIDVVYGLSAAGTGGVLFASRTPMSAASIFSSSASRISPAGMIINATVAADFDKDGLIDIIGGSRFQPAVMMKGTGPGSFAAPVAVLSGTSPAAFIKTGDFNGDGNRDVVLLTTGATGDPSLSALVNNGSGVFSAYTSFQVNWSTSAIDQAWLAVQDINNDGLDDILACRTDGDLTVSYSVNASGGRVVYTIATTGAGLEGCVLADINNDGCADIVTGGSSLFWAYGDCKGNFGSFQFTSPPSANAYKASAIDLDGDGWIDILSTKNDKLDIYFNRGDGTFSGSTSIIGPNGMWHTVPADYNNDGLVDIAVMGVASTMLYINNGQRTFSAPKIYPAPQAYTGTAVDTNADGKVDLIINTFDEGAVQLLNFGCP